MGIWMIRTDLNVDGKVRLGRLHADGSETCWKVGRLHLLTHVYVLSHALRFCMRLN